MSTAARRLGITQSAISQQIGNLEKSLGAALVDRGLRPLRPTSDGEQLIARAVPFLEEAGRILVSARALRNEPLPQLRLSVLFSLSLALSPALVAGLHAQVPIRNIVVTAGLANTLRHSLMNRETDILVTSDPLLDLDALERHEVLVEPFVLLVPAGAPDLGNDLQKLAQVLPFVRYHSNSPIGIRIEVHLRRQRIEVARWCEFDTPESVVAMVASGQGWTITSPLHVLQGVRDWDLVRCLRLPIQGMARSTVVVARRGELGELPTRVATLAREIVWSSVVPAVTERMPFLKGDCRRSGVVHLHERAVSA